MSAVWMIRIDDLPTPLDGRPRRRLYFLNPTGARALTRPTVSPPGFVHRGFRRTPAVGSAGRRESHSIARTQEVEDTGRKRRGNLRSAGRTGGGTAAAPASPAPSAPPTAAPGTAGPALRSPRARSTWTGSTRSNSGA